MIAGPKTEQAVGELPTQASTASQMMARLKWLSGETDGHREFWPTKAEGAVIAIKMSSSTEKVLWDAYVQVQQEYKDIFPCWVGRAGELIFLVGIENANYAPTMEEYDNAEWVVPKSAGN